MAELILTEAEKAAASYMDWDDAALGKFTKKVALTLEGLKDDAEGLHKVTVASCAMMLIGQAFDANADKLTLKLDGHTHGDIETGDWVVAVRRVREKK